MTATKETRNSLKQTIDNTQELRDALFHAICLLDHAKPENDTDHRDVTAARELIKLRDALSKQEYAFPEEVSAARKPVAKRRGASR